MRDAAHKKAEEIEQARLAAAAQCALRQRVRLTRMMMINSQLAYVCYQQNTTTTFVSWRRCVHWQSRSMMTAADRHMHMIRAAVHLGRKPARVTGTALRLAVGQPQQQPWPHDGLRVAGGPGGQQWGRVVPPPAQDRRPSLT